MRLAAGWFAFGFAHEFFGLDFVAAAIDGGDIVIFAEKVDEHSEIFVVHNDDGAVVVSHQFKLHLVGVVNELVLGHFFGDVQGLEFLDERFAVLEKGV